MELADRPRARPTWDLGTTSLAAQVMLWAFTLPLLLFCFHELEPLLYFHPVDAVVQGSGVAPIRYFTRYHMVTRYQSDIFYSYTVAGAPFMGSRFRRTETGSPLLSAEVRALSLTQGMKVRAWYNPFRPEEAVLSLAPCPQLFGGALFTLGLLWVGELVRKRSIALRIRGA
jgi:hypothetical protein